MDAAIGTVPQPEWDDSWRAFRATKTNAFFGACSGRATDWAVNLDTREVQFSGCFVDRQLSGNEVLTEAKRDELVADLRALVRSEAACSSDNPRYEVRIATPGGERVLEDPLGSCGSTGTRVAGLPGVFEVLTSIVP